MLLYKKQTRFLEKFSLKLIEQYLFQGNIIVLNKEIVRLQLFFTNLFLCEQDYLKTCKGFESF